MKYAKKLRKGDKVAIVSLSSGMLGEAFCSHNIKGIWFRNIVYAKFAKRN